MSLFCTVSEIYRDTGRKSPFEPTPLLFGAPVGSDSVGISAGFILRQKTRVPALSYSVACVILHLFVWIQHRRVTDRHTAYIQR